MINRGDRDGIGTSKTYRFLLRDFHPFCILLETPVTILNFTVLTKKVGRLGGDM
jgi:hypothetical protein